MGNGKSEVKVCRLCLEENPLVSTGIPADDRGFPQLACEQCCQIVGTVYQFSVRSNAAADLMRGFIEKAGPRPSVDALKSRIGGVSGKRSASLIQEQQQQQLPKSKIRNVDKKSVPSAVMPQSAVKKKYKTKVAAPEEDELFGSCHMIIRKSTAIAKNK